MISTDGASGCMCRCVRFGPGMREWSVVYSRNAATAAVQRQPCFKVLPLCQQSRCMCCCWRTAGDRTTTTLLRPMQRSNNHRRTTYQGYKAYSSSTNSSSSCISLERLRSPYSTWDTPGILVSSTPHRGGEPCTSTA